MNGASGMSQPGEDGSAPLPAGEQAIALTPIQRLAQSRERLRLVLAPPPAAGDGAAGGSGLSWEQRLRAIPGLAFVVDVVQAWWQQHPLRVATAVAREVSRAAARPIAGRHPFALVAVAAVVGAALAWARPWRWALKSALFAGLLPQFASRMATALPIEDWINVLGSLMSRAKPPAAGASAAAPDAAADAASDAESPAAARAANAPATSTPEPAPAY